MGCSNHYRQSAPPKRGDEETYTEKADPIEMPSKFGSFNGS